MDVDLLSKMIKELILDNDKVVLPGLGAFVAEIVPASFTDKGYTINPPYRRLSFRSKPDEGDLLTNFYASSNDLSHEVADKVISDFISELRSILYIKKVVVLPGLGRLRATKENSVFFIADEDLDIYPEGFGLEPISLKTHQETKAEVRAAVSELRAIVDEPVVTPVVETVPENVEIDEPGVVDEPVIIEEPLTEQPEVQKEPVKEVVEQDVKVPANGYKKFFKILLWLVILVIVLLAIFVGVSRLYPEIIDNILYSTEELEILKSNI